VTLVHAEENEANGGSFVLHRMRCFSFTESLQLPRRMKTIESRQLLRRMKADDRKPATTVTDHDDR
jgi:hypothetical protein